MQMSSLVDRAKEIRRDIVKMGYVVGGERKCHPGPALSAADIVAVLYFKHMNVDPKNPQMKQRDRFILSKGHAAPVIYAALACKGFFDKSEYNKLRDISGGLQGHPDMKGTPGIDMTAGSLGHGLSAGVGMAIAARIDKLDYMTYVIIGDGESQEGLVWEAAMYAPYKKLDNLVAIIDRNRFQSCAATDEILCMDPFADKWKSFGWKVLEIDGHDIEQIDKAIAFAKENKDGKPTAIIANTIKGKGVDFMENDNSWHQQALSEAQYESAMSQLA